MVLEGRRREEGRGGQASASFARAGSPVDKMDLIGLGGAHAEIEQSSSVEIRGLLRVVSVDTLFAVLAFPSVRGLNDSAELSEGLADFDKPLDLVVRPAEVLQALLVSPSPRIRARPASVRCVLCWSLSSVVVVVFRVRVMLGVPRYHCR